MKIAAILLLVSVFALGAYGANWAVVVAGSNGFWNYRHQTDACHAYQILIKNGIPADNIIHFSYNDVANDGENPFRGKLFNKPDPSGPGVDVYANCKIDYQKGDNTPQNFMYVLKGNETAMHGKGTGKVLKSGPNDKVFIYFTDHGATDLIAFPSDYLYSDDLLKTFDYMYQQKLYGELVFYLEACESGSMFVNLPKNTKIYATSAANPYESSWAYYCSPDDVVNHQSIGSCLGDEYSVKWLEDSDAADFKTETLHAQFLTVQKNTQLSHVMEWGDQSFNTEPIGNFQGGAKAEKVVRSLRVGDMSYEVELPAAANKLDSRDVKLFYLMNKHQKKNTLESELALKAELDSRNFFNAKFDKLRDILSISAEEVAATSNTANIECLKASVALFEEKCTKLTDYGLKFVKTLAATCSKVETEVVLNVIENVCV